MGNFKTFLLKEGFDYGKVSHKVAKKLEKFKISQDNWDIMVDEITNYFEDTAEDINKISDEEFKSIVKFIQKEIN